MADEEAEAAFISSMQTRNEADGTHEAVGEIGEQQIDSSDEYDPSQDVQDLMSPGIPNLSEQKPHISALQNDLLSSVSTPQSSTPTHAPNGLAVPIQDVAQSESRNLTQSVEHDTTTSNQNNQLQHLHATQYNPAPVVEQSGLDSSDKLQPPQRASSSTPLKNIPVADDLVPNSTPDPPSVAFKSDPANSGIDHDTVMSAAGMAVVEDSSAAKSTDVASDLPAVNLQTSMETKKLTNGPMTPKARLPHDKIGILEDRIKEDERGDLDAWLTLIDEHKKRGKLDEARKVYERFLAIFPSSAEQWVAFARMENDIDNRNGVESIFNNTLLHIPSVELWSMYLDHIRRYNNVTTDVSGSARNLIYQAYDLALTNIGIDKDSGKIWQDFIQFIKSGPGNVGGSNWQDQQKMDLLRKAYQRGICVPTQAVNNLWKEYNSFEMGLNNLTGRKFLQEQSPIYMSARISYTAVQNITRDLRRTSLPALPPAAGFDGDVEYTRQLEIWQRWIQWEKDDPLELKSEDLGAYKDRVCFVYKQALMAMRFWPEMWFEAADFCLLNSLEAEGTDFLSQGITANPESCLLAFKRADRLEITTTSEEGDEGVKQRGTMVREPYDKVLDALYNLITRSTTREARELARIEAHFTALQGARPNGIAEEDDDRGAEEAETEMEIRKKQQTDAIKSINAVQIRLLQRAISHTWIALMRAMRRIQGKGKVGDLIGGSRQIFTDARKKGRITSDVWIAAALLEFHCYEVEAAKRIFERGVKLFPEDEVFALEYIKHLIATNDHTNARVIFETSVGKLVQKPENIPKTRALYAFFHNFETRYGELSQITKLEKRMGDLFPGESKLNLFRQRFSQEFFDPTSIRPIISPGTQARPKMMPAIDPPSVQNSPPNKYIPTTLSPKRPMPFEDSDTEVPRPRKLPRGESPLAGAAGRKLDQHRNRQPHEVPQIQDQIVSQVPPPTLPRDVKFLLSIIPKASTYHATKFKAEEMVRLIRDTPLPNNVPLQQPQQQAQQMRMGMQRMPQLSDMSQLSHVQFNGMSPLSSHTPFNFVIAPASLFPNSLYGSNNLVAGSKVWSSPGHSAVVGNDLRRQVLMGHRD